MNETRRAAHEEWLVMNRSREYWQGMSLVMKCAAFEACTDDVAECFGAKPELVRYLFWLRNRVDELEKRSMWRGLF